MPSPADHPSLHLTLLPKPFYVIQSRDAEEDILQRMRAAGSSGFFSVTRTADEVSLVGEATAETPTEEAKWRCIKVAGPMDFGLTGIMSALTGPLAKAGVPIFAISTWNTDYVLVPKEKVDQATTALSEDGWKFVG